MIKLTSIAAFTILFATISPIAFASEITSVDVSDFTSKSFLLEEELKVILDGSPAASDIQQRSTTYNRVTFLDPENWRAYRSRPLQRTAKEYIKIQNQVFELTPGNQRNKTLEKVTDRFWQEAVAAPVLYAREWSLINSSDGLKDLVSKLKGAPELTLKNVEGDRISATIKADGSITLVSRGRILQDGKTSIQIESMWRLFQIEKVAEADLNRSLLRGHDQR